MPKSNKVVTINDSDVGSSAQILVDEGFNCFSFKACFDGERIETLWSAAGFAQGGRRASSSGIPILFPFPGRIGRSEFQWNNRSYTLESNDGRGNAIHGFVYTRPWRVLERNERSVSGQFQASVDDPAILSRWPADFRITAEYRLDANTLNCTYILENPDDKPLPCGLGAHPYFRLPLGGEDAAECQVTLPVGGEWELADLVPTGEYWPLRDAELFGQGLPFAEMQFDNVFGDLTWDADGWSRATIRDPSSQHQLTVAFTQPFRECVVYTPDHREAICIEPYTCVPNPFALSEKGIETGLRIVPPGDSFRLQMRITVE